MSAMKANQSKRAATASSTLAASNAKSSRMITLVQSADERPVTTTRSNLNSNAAPNSSRSRNPSHPNKNNVPKKASPARKPATSSHPGIALPRDSTTEGLSKDQMPMPSVAAGGKKRMALALPSSPSTLINLSNRQSSKNLAGMPAKKSPASSRTVKATISSPKPKSASKLPKKLPRKTTVLSDLSTGQRRATMEEEVDTLCPVCEDMCTCAAASRSSTSFPINNNHGVSTSVRRQVISANQTSKKLKRNATDATTKIGNGASSSASRRLRKTFANREAYESGHLHFTDSEGEDNEGKSLSGNRYGERRKSWTMTSNFDDSSSFSEEFDAFLSSADSSESCLDSATDSLMDDDESGDSLDETPAANRTPNESSWLRPNTNVPSTSTYSMTMTQEDWTADILFEFESRPTTFLNDLTGAVDPPTIPIADRVATVTPQVLAAISAVAKSLNPAFSRKPVTNQRSIVYWSGDDDENENEDDHFYEIMSDNYYGMTTSFHADGFDGQRKSMADNEMLVQSLIEEILDTAKLPKGLLSNVISRPNKDVDDGDSMSNPSDSSIDDHATDGIDALERWSRIPIGAFRRRRRPSLVNTQIYRNHPNRSLFPSNAIHSSQRDLRVSTLHNTMLAALRPLRRHSIVAATAIGALDEDQKTRSSIGKDGSKMEWEDEPWNVIARNNLSMTPFGEDLMTLGGGSGDGYHWPN